MKLLYRLNFRSQLTISFALIICFLISSIMLMLNTILRESYRGQESLILENYGRQIAINIGNRIDYFASYLHLLSLDPEFTRVMETQPFKQVNETLKKKTTEFMYLNAGRVNGIRIYRNGVYSVIDGLGKTHDVFSGFTQGSTAYNNNLLITGTYLNSRNEKVFSIFRRAYQTNTSREYYIEMCVYETEIFGFFNDDTSSSRIMIENGGKLMSMNDRQDFNRLLYSNRGNNGFGVDSDPARGMGRAVLISATGISDFDVLIETDTSYLERGYRMMLIRMIPVLIIVLIVSFTFVALISMRLNRRLRTLQEKIAVMSNWNLNQDLRIEGQDEFGMLANELDNTRKRILDLITQNNNMNEMMRVAEMSALRAQINSHFFFNSLSTIRWLARSGRLEPLTEAVDCLAIFLRYSLALNENQVLLSSEIRQLEAYIYLQNLRYGDEVNVNLDIEEELLQCKTVKLILQPLVENAISHGRRDNVPLNITIYSYVEDGWYNLIVEDDGNGISPEQLELLCAGRISAKQSGYGLKNVIERVRMCTNGAGEVIIESEQGVYTKISIRQSM